MQEIKLNLGCGTNVLDGWINMDNSPSVHLSKFPLVRRLLFRWGTISKISFQTTWPKGVVWCDVNRGLPYPEGSVHKVYSSHMLEHLERKKGESFLRECFRVLKKGGGSFDWWSPI